MAVWRLERVSAIHPNEGRQIPSQCTEQHGGELIMDEDYKGIHIQYEVSDGIIK